jgi:hypothetical protein
LQSEETQKVLRLFDRKKSKKQGLARSDQPFQPLF